MRQFLALVLAVLAVQGAPRAVAQEAMPDARVVVSRDVDYPGGDLAAIFDTTLDACEAACRANAQCTAYTFNQRSSACFPKVFGGTVTPYEGAVSARLIRTTDGARALAATRGADLGFLAPEDIAAARDLAGRLGRLHAADEFPAADLLAFAADARGAGDLMRALRLTGAAASITDGAAEWLEYGRLARLAEGATEDETNAARRNATAALVNAYLRSDGSAAQTAALLELALALEAEGRGRLMIPALRLAQAIAPRADIAEDLDRATGLYGFRVADTQIDSDSASPRICAVFSEPLVQAGVDYATFVQLPDARLPVSVEDASLCIEGVVHGERYRIGLREGLPAASGETLGQTVDLDFYVRDRAPAVRFTSRAYVLPRVGDVAIPVETVNLEEITLRLARVSDRNILRAIEDDLFASPLYAWQADTFENQIGTPFWEGRAAVEGALNEDRLTRLPLGEALAGQAPGVYVLQASFDGADPYETPPATQWFVLSDLGLSTFRGVDGLTVVVRSLADGSAVAGAEVELLSRANAVLGTALTDADGVARFEAGLVRGTGPAAPGLVTATLGDADLGFLSLTGPAFDLSDRGVEGREPAPPIDAFLATDRGAYRAGETIWATALLRDDRAAALPGLPLTAVLTRPDGVEYSRQISASDLAGGHVFALPVAATAPRGTWTIEVMAEPDRPLATTRVLVEDFLPERIDFTMTTEPVLSPGRPSVVAVQANYLFGPPAPGLAIEGDILVAPRADVPLWPGFVFGLHDAPFEPRRAGLGGGETGPDGSALVEFDLPETEGGLAQPVEARLTLRVAEGSGRPVERRLTVPMTGDLPLIGIRPAFDGVVPEGGTASFEIVGLGPDLAPLPMDATWTVNRVERTYQWFQLFGEWNWEPVTRRTRVAQGTIRLDGAPVRVEAPVAWGNYEIVVERTDGDYIAASTTFDAGWYAPADAGATPDFLEVSLDAPAYAVGDTARFRIVPREAGTALVTVMTNRLVAMRIVAVGAGENVVELPVTDEWGAGAYVAASVLRPMDLAASRNPARAMGIAHAGVEPGERRLGVTLDWNEDVAPRGPLRAGVAVTGLAPGERAYVTLAAVDLGVLNLTGFEAPDPAGHYFGQRKLGVELRDIYGRLIDGLNGALGAVRSGGDSQAGLDSGAPPPEEVLALFSGPVAVDATGRAEIGFDLPAFNGTVRLMAIAWSPTGVGQASADILVRDPVVVTASLPRFLAPGDTSRLRLEITHAEGAAGEMALRIDAGGLGLAEAGLPQSVTLSEGGTAVVEAGIVAPEPGDYALNVALTTPDGTVLTKTLMLGVRRNDPETVRISRFELAPGQTFTFDDQAFAGFAPGSGRAVMSAGPLARFDAPGLLATLDRYPYGCTEQITSQALPLLYFAEVAEAMGIAQERQVASRIDAAIREILGNQAANGAFGLWGATSGDLWLDAYVTDFLGRARDRGHAVPETAWQSALDNLRNQVNYAPDFEAGGEAIAYALMVLAREGEARVGDLRYYADERSQAFTTPLGAAQLGAALAFYGDPLRADVMFARAMDLIRALPEGADAPVWRVDYGTARRDIAAVLALATEARSEAVDATDLTARLARAGERVSTQEAVWTLLAADALIDGLEDTGLLIDGQPPEGPLLRVHEAGGATRPVTVLNGGARATDLTVTAFGVPETPLPAGGNGFAIERAFFTMEGAPADPGRVAAGTRLVAVLTVTPFGRQEARLMVDDPLPAGFEIDNPNLLRGGDVRGLDWLDPAPTQDVEFRADRFLAAVDWQSDRPFRLAYVVRAVSPGVFHHPAAQVEDMYRPERRAWTDAGRVEVTD